MLTRMATSTPARVLIYAIVVDVAVIILLAALLVRTVKENNPQLYASAPTVPTATAARNINPAAQATGSVAKTTGLTDTNTHTTTKASSTKGAVSSRHHATGTDIHTQVTNIAHHSVVAGTTAPRLSLLPAPPAPPMPVLLAQHVAQVAQRSAFIALADHPVILHHSTIVQHPAIEYPRMVHQSHSTGQTLHPSKAIVYVAIGASDTVGIGATDPATQGWVADLSRTLPAGSRTVNLGISGILIHGILSQELPRAVASHPDLVTVWTAVNDFNAQVALSAYERDLNQLITTLRRTTHARIYVANIPELSLVPSYASLPAPAVRAEVAAWNTAIAEEVRATGGVLIDLHTPSLTTLPAHPEYVSGDKFHPSTAGYNDIARTFEQVISKNFRLVITPKTSSPTARLSIGRATLAPAAALVSRSSSSRTIRSSTIQSSLRPGVPPTPTVLSTTRLHLNMPVPLAPPTPAKASR